MEPENIELADQIAVVQGHFKSLSERIDVLEARMDEKERLNVKITETVSKSDENQEVDFKEEGDRAEKRAKGSRVMVYILVAFVFLLIAWMMAKCSSTSQDTLVREVESLKKKVAEVDHRISVMESQSPPVLAAVIPDKTEPPQTAETTPAAEVSPASDKPTPDDPSEKIKSIESALAGAVAALEKINPQVENITPKIDAIEKRVIGVEQKPWPQLDPLEKRVASLEKDVESGRVNLDSQLVSLRKDIEFLKNELSHPPPGGGSAEVPPKVFDDVLKKIQELNDKQKAISEKLYKKPEQFEATLCQGASVRAFSSQVLIRLINAPSAMGADFDIALPNSGMLRIRDMRPGSRRPFEVNRDPYFFELIRVENMCTDIVIYPKKDFVGP